jgi:formylglycine-generating enzyme required for sulfatase activity
MVVVPAGDAVAAFEIDRAPVTLAHYRLCIEAGRCGATARDRTATCDGAVRGGGRPAVNCVNRSDAAAYCNWAGKRLPSRDELEKAGAPANAAVARDALVVAIDPNDGVGGAVVSLRCAR